MLQQNLIISLPTYPKFCWYATGTSHIFHLGLIAIVSLAVLCLERGIAGFPGFYRPCPLKMQPVRAYGRALYADFSLFKPCFRIKCIPVKGRKTALFRLCMYLLIINVALDIDFSSSPIHQQWQKRQILFS